MPRRRWLRRWGRGAREVMIAVAGLRLDMQKGQGCFTTFAAATLKGRWEGVLEGDLNHWQVCGVCLCGKV
jgi:hypothetical protein